MTYVVTARCVDCRYTYCLVPCPVTCFYEVKDPHMLVIDPDTCVDCDACVPECPTVAIFEETELPEKWAEWTEINARLSANWPVISEKKDPLPDADEWKDVEHKRDKLSETAYQES